MTAAEISEVLAVMAVAWPNSELAKADDRLMRLTVSVWADAAKDIDVFFGKRAIKALCKKSKFQPTIAEFIEEAKAQESEYEEKLFQHWQMYAALGPEEYKNAFGKDTVLPLMLQSHDFYEFEKLCRSKQLGHARKELPK